jgi:hypothetical protein
MYLLTQCWHGKRGIVICQSSQPSSYHSMINAKLPCDVIYSKEYDHGTLYALKLSNRMSHKSISEKLDLVDKSMRSLGSPERTRFRSINNDPFGGKIKTFEVGEHGGDPYYCAIFKTIAPGGGRKLEAHDDVVKWVCADGGADAVFDEIDESGEDEDEDIQTPDPKPNGKRRAEVSSIELSKKLRVSDGDSVAGEESALEVQRLREELDGSKAEIKELKKEISAAQANADPVVSVCLFHCLR